MCVIMAKPAGVAVPDRDTLRKCFERNPDGAGMMYPNVNGKVSIAKGYATFEAFDKALSEVESSCDPVQLPLVLHFRIGTHGSKNDPRHTHPFPVCDSYEEMEKLVSEADLAMAHNGIIHFGPIGASGLNGPSDSMEFARRVLLPLSRIEGWLDDEAVKGIIDGALTSSNKVVVMQSDGSIRWYGPNVQHLGCLWSNTSYEGYVPKPVAPSKDITSYWAEWQVKQGTFAFDKPSVKETRTPFADDLEDFLEDFSTVTKDLQHYLALVFRGMEGGYDMAEKRHLKPFYEPCTVHTTSRISKRKETYKVHSPFSCFLRDADELYFLDMDTDELTRVGKIDYINPKPNLRTVVGKKEDFRKSALYAEMYA